MSNTQFWINLPVKDMETSKAFWRAIGFKENERFSSNPTTGCFFLDKNNTVMMLFPENQINTFMQHAVTDTTTSNEVLFNISADSPEEVDAMAARVQNAGGTIFAQPGASQGWMYAFGFSDPDGHRWSMLYMDMSKMPK